MARDVPLPAAVTAATAAFPALIHFFSTDSECRLCLRVLLRPINCTGASLPHRRRCSLPRRRRPALLPACWKLLGTKSQRPAASMGPPRLLLEGTGVEMVTKEPR